MRAVRKKRGRSVRAARHHNQIRGARPDRPTSTPRRKDRKTRADRDASSRARACSLFSQRSRRDASTPPTDATGGGPTARQPTWPEPALPLPAAPPPPPATPDAAVPGREAAPLLAAPSCGAASTRPFATTSSSRVASGMVVRPFVLSCSETRSVCAALSSLYYGPPSSAGPKARLSRCDEMQNPYGPCHHLYRPPSRARSQTSPPPACSRACAGTASGSAAGRAAATPRGRSAPATTPRAPCRAPWRARTRRTVSDSSL